MISNMAEKLRSLKIPVTAQRLAVMRAVEECPHATADKIADLVEQELGAISRQSVYNVLGMLTEHDLVRKIQPAGSAALYETRTGDNHHHLVCRECGLTIDVDCAVGYAPCLTPSDDAGFIIDEAEVIYWGICPKCQEKKKT